MNFFVEQYISAYVTLSKSIFVWFAVFYKKNHPSYGKEHSVEI